MKKTVVVTGATSGIGFAVGKLFAEGGWRVLLLGRTQEKCDAAKAELTTQFPQAEIATFTADLSLMRETADVSAKIIEFLNEKCDGKLDILVNNAGAVRSKRTLTEENIELQFATNYLSAFLLTQKLLPALENANGAVISTGSDSHRFAFKLRWKDIMFRRGYTSLAAYAHSKLALLLFSGEAKRRFDGKIRFYAVDPGLVNTAIGGKNTKGITRLFWKFRRRHGTEPSVPAKTYFYLAQEQPDGLYYLNCKPQKQSKASKKVIATEKLFCLSEQLCSTVLSEGKLK